ncbi:MAG: hypothetical protein FWD17_14455 [Polyangiaceae bacterium]|nr:hypothetical protein [Polyangiaceae bacterium]
MRTRFHKRFTWSLVPFGFAVFTLGCSSNVGSIPADDGGSEEASVAAETDGATTAQSGEGGIDAGLCAPCANYLQCCLDQETGDAGDCQVYSVAECEELSPQQQFQQGVYCTSVIQDGVNSGTPSCLMAR